MISYEPFWETLRKRGISMYRLIKCHKICGGTLYRMKAGKAVSSKTIDDLCRILQCTVSEIIEYVDDENL